MSHGGHWAYLPFLLAWALPIVAVEWLAGARILWRERGVWPWIVLALTAWFTLADAVAIGAGIWRFDTASLLGLYLGPVPIEEILFYLLTSAMVVQGFVLLHAGMTHRLVRRARARDEHSPARLLPPRHADGVGGEDSRPAPIGSADG